MSLICYTIFKRICKEYSPLHLPKGNTWERHSFSVFSQVLDFSRVGSWSSSILTAMEGSAFPGVLSLFWICLYIWFLAQPVAVNSKVNYMQWQKKSFWFNTATWFHCSWGGIMNNSECAFSDLRASYRYNLSLSLLLEAFKRINLTFYRFKYFYLGLSDGRNT